MELIGAADFFFFMISPQKLVEMRSKSYIYQ